MLSIDKDIVLCCEGPFFYFVNDLFNFFPVKAKNDIIYKYD